MAANGRLRPAARQIPFTEYGVHRDAQNVWAVGDNGTILRWVSSKWTAQSSPTANGLLDFGAVIRAMEKSCRRSRAVPQMDGATWIAQAGGGSPSLYGVFGERTRPTSGQWV